MPSHVRLTPNQSRLLYDAVVSTAAAVVAFGFGWTFLGRAVLALFLGPPLVVAGNWLLGIYTTHKVGAGLGKAIRLSVSLMGSTAGVLALSRDMPVSLLWFALLWAPLALPRLLLNLNTRVKTNFVTSAIVRRGPVLVVGGAGYIGTHLVQELLRANMSVRI